MTAWLENAWELIQGGGPVMIPLFGLSIWMWVLIAAKAVSLFHQGRGRLGLDQALKCLEKDDPLPPEASGPQADALNFFIKWRCRRVDPDRLFWEAAVKRQFPIINRHVGTVIILAASAPVLGLLGTIGGMIETFEALCLHGTGNARALAMGIEEALITTQTGLLIAIPGLLSGQALRRMVRTSEQELLAFSRAIDQYLITTPLMERDSKQP
ncbi:MAG: MotA/TolQ/ExbB proton channel family protein [Pseudomonadota bacterium]